jgi:cobalamin biosynthetic protein CobC
VKTHLIAPAVPGVIAHGGNLRRAMAQYGGQASDWMDLSTGINPHAYPAPPIAPDAWHRLPEPDTGLVDAACAYYGAPVLLPVAGTQAAIQALPRLRAHSRVAVVSPTYAEHALRWREAGHAVTEIAPADIEVYLDHCDVLVVCNPNNPTGHRVKPEMLLAWADRLAARGGWLVVDEAFGDMEPALSVAAHCQQPGLIVLRSVGKFFGLAGLRLGFVGAEPNVLERLSALLGPWSISGPAQQVGRAALADVKWQQTMRLRLAADGARLRTLLARHVVVTSASMTDISKTNTSDAHASDTDMVVTNTSDARTSAINRPATRGTDLFQWWPAPAPTALHEHLAQQRIWVRLFPDAARGLRVGLPAAESDWARLDLALAGFQNRA